MVTTFMRSIRKRVDSRDLMLAGRDGCRERHMHCSSTSYIHTYPTRIVQKTPHRHISDM
jgi:hypothetical protein